MRKNWVAIITVILFFAPFILPFLMLLIFGIGYAISDLQLNPYDYARITDVEYRAVVVDEPDCEGKVVITERLTYDIHAASEDNLFWELWRDLPEDYVDGVKVHYKVNSVKQIMPDGSEVIYEKSPKLYWDDYDYVSYNPTYGPGKWYHSKGPYDESEERYECVFFYVDGLYREEVVFEIEYEMYNAALRYNDCSDLYLSMYSETTINHLESYKAEILFPNDKMPSPGNYEVYTYGTNAHSFPVTGSANKNPGYYTFSFELDEEDLQFKPYNQYIEFDLVSYNEDKHIFTEYASRNYYSSDNVLDEIRDEQRDYANEPAIYAKLKIVVFLMCVGGAIIALVYAFTIRSRMKSKHTFYEPSMEIDYYRDIPSDLDPNFASALVFCKDKPLKDDSGVYSAILLSLARKEYIKLDELGNDVRITIAKQNLPTPVVTPAAAPMASPIMQSTTQSTTSEFGDIGTGYTSTYRPTSNQITIIDNTRAGQVSVMNGGGLYPVPTDTVAPAPVVAPAPTVAPAAISTPEIAPVSIPEPVSTEPVVSDPFAAETPASEPVVQAPVKVYEPLTTCEQYYFNLLVRHAGPAGVIMMSTFQSRVSSDYANTNAFATNMENSIVNIGIKERYFQKADYKQPQRQLRSNAKTLWIFGILFLTLVNIISYRTRMDLAFGGFFIVGIAFMISSKYLKKQSSKYILLTQYGEDEYEKWRGLYNFLNSETLIKERTFIELPLWEKYLVYATAFGLSEKIIKAISLNCPDAAESVILSNNYCRSRRIHHSGRSFRSSVRSGSSFGGGGGGFGYGGGGRGGGGGGGGH